MDLWLAAELELHDGRRPRFGPDERDDADVPKDISFDTSIPGGFANGSLTLSRPPSLRADDARLFAGARIYGPGDDTVYRGRVTGIPQVGASEIRMELEGPIAVLDDDKHFRQTYVDRDQNGWDGPSVQRQLNLLQGAPTRTPHDPSVEPDPATGAPAIKLAVQFPIAHQTVIEAWYLGHEPLSEVYIDPAGYDLGLAGFGSSTNWIWSVISANDDVNSGGVSRAGGDSATPAAGYVSLGGQPCVRLDVRRLTNIASNEGREQGLLHRAVTIYGVHGLEKHGPDPGGVLGSDVLAHALAGVVPFTTGPGGSIEPSTYVIPHLAFKGPGETTRRNLVEHVTALGGGRNVPNDWGIYEDFFWRSPGTYGRTWRVRRDQYAEPTSEGPDAESRTTRYVIEYTDGSGTQHSVGPPGSGAEFIDASLEDPDPTNPARHTDKVELRSVGITNLQGATNIGRLLMREQNELRRRGSVQIDGPVRDSLGNLHAPSAVRAGDRVVIEDDEEPTEEPINSTSYSHSDLSVTANVGAPPHNLEVLLARLAAVTEHI